MMRPPDRDLTEPAIWRSIAAFWSVVALLAAALPAQAALELDLDGAASRDRMVYACDDGAERRVDYVNLPANSLAILEIGGERLLFVNVVSGSGARYVSGSYVWWTKGGKADLSNEQDPAQRVHCAQKEERR